MSMNGYLLNDGGVIKNTYYINFGVRENLLCDGGFINDVSVKCSIEVLEGDGCWVLIIIFFFVIRISDAPDYN